MKYWRQTARSPGYIQRHAGLQVQLQRNYYHKNAVSQNAYNTVLPVQSCNGETRTPLPDVDRVPASRATRRDASLSRGQDVGPDNGRIDQAAVNKVGARIPDLRPPRRRCQRTQVKQLDDVSGEKLPFGLDLDKYRTHIELLPSLALISSTSLCSSATWPSPVSIR